MTPNQRKLWGRIGGLTTASRYDGREQTAKARAGFIKSFLDQVPTDLPTAERERRANALLRLHYTKMAAKSAAVRRKRAAR